MGGASVTDIGAGLLTGGAYTLTKAAIGALKPGQPSLTTPPQAPDLADAAMRNARLMERRKQLGLSGRMSTFLTTAQGEGGASQPASTGPAVVNLLGG